MLKPSEQGFSLVELMVTLTLLSLLMLGAAPTFSEWIANARVRSVAEEIANGLRMAQSEAMRRNRPTVFVVTNSTPAKNATPSTNGNNWYVQALPLTSGATSESAVSTDYVQGGNFATSSSVTVTSTSSVVCFGPMGSMVAIAANDAINVLGVACTTETKNYTVSRAGATRALKVYAGIGGQVRMCDPTKTLGTNTPDGCPA